MNGPPRAKPVPSRAGAWPPDLWLSPTKLKIYNGCPHRTRLQYVDKVKTVAPYSLFLEEGRIAHDLLSDAAKRLKVQAPLRSEADLMAQAINRMKADEFPSLAAHEASARKIVKWYRAGLAHIDREARFLNIESTGKREFPLPSMPDVRLTMSTRPDLILLRTDADGQPFVDIVDYKTGQVWVDPVPPITMRFVFKTLFQKIDLDTRSIPMQFSYVFLEHGETEIIPLTPDYCTEAWNEVLQLAERLMAEREWLPTPSRGCNYCPFHQRECSETAPIEQDWA